MFREPDHRHRWPAERRDRILEAARAFSEGVPAPYRTPLELAGRFALARPEVGAIIPGATRRNQIEANLRLGELPDPPPETIRRIEACFPDPTLANPG